MKFFRIGKVVDSHGMDGEIKVLPITDNPEIFDEIDFMMLSKDGNVVKSCKLEYLSYRTQYFLCKLMEIDSIDKAKEIKGLDIVIPENMLPETQSGEVYWKDIEGSKVFDSENNEIGILQDYMETGGSDIFNIVDNTGKEFLISNNPEHVLEINEKEKKIIINKDGLVSDEL